MKQGRLKYGCKIGGTMMQKGTRVTILDPSDPSVQAVWNGIKWNPRSNDIAVQFEGKDHPTIMHISEVEVE